MGFVLLSEAKHPCTRRQPVNAGELHKIVRLAQDDMNVRED